MRSPIPQSMCPSRHSRLTNWYKSIHRSQSTNGGCWFYRVLRPALERGSACVGQFVDAALGAVEPAIDVVKKDLAGVRNPFAKVANAPRPIQQRGGAGQRLLAIGRHDGCARTAAERRIA